MKLTAKLSKPNKPIVELIRQQNGLRGPIVWNNIQGSALYVGTSYAGTAGWVDFISSGTDNNLGRLRNEGALALLFIPIDNRYMVFCFGYGNSKLSSTGWERDFGLKVVLNTINPNKVKSLDAKTVDTVIMNRRVQLSKENRIHDFGFEIDKDFLKSITGKATDQNFAKVLGGSENLTINTDVELANFFNKVQQIYEQFNSLNYQAHYGWIDNVKNVQDADLIENLNSELSSDFNALLNDEEIDRYFNIACPEIIDYANVSHFKIKGFGDRENYENVDIEDVIGSMQGKGIAEVTIDDLTNYRIEARNDDDRAMNNWPIYYWLVFECEFEGSFYVFSEGDWYLIHNVYYDAVNARYVNILDIRNGEYIALPETEYQNERTYLDNYAVSADEFIFDSALSYVYGPQNSIEICDIYNFQKEFIHVKDGSSSSKLSHLFNQGYVSGSMFLGDVLFREDIAGKLRDNRKGRLARTISNNPKANDYTVVFRILKKGENLTLPFFTQIVIIDMYRRIKSMGYQFRLEWVKKS